MSTPTSKPAYVTLHRLGDSIGKARNTLLLRIATVNFRPTPVRPPYPVWPAQ